MRGHRTFASFFAVSVSSLEFSFLSAVRLFFLGGIVENRANFEMLEQNSGLNYDKVLASLSLVLVGC